VAVPERERERASVSVSSSSSPRAFVSIPQGILLGVYPDLKCIPKRQERCLISKREASMEAIEEV